MSLSHPIRIRLNEEQFFRYESAAARLGKPLATYLRECLESHEDNHSVASLKREFLALRHMLEDWTDKVPSNEVESGGHPLLMEIVLLLRQLAKPEHVRIAQGELRRLGVLAE
jgi:predicted DNA-binding protein